MKKLCRKCNEVKLETQFNKHSRDGLQSVCRACQGKSNREWISNHPEYMKQYRLDNIQCSTSIIYAIYRKSDMEIVYIGECLTTLENRISRHKCDAFTMGSNKLIHKAIREFGFDEFGFVVIDDTVDPNPIYTEWYFINMLKPIYNVQSGNKIRQARELMAA